MPRTIATIAGLTAVDSGAGPEVVLVHGSLGDYRQWVAIARELGKSYRVVALSRRGHWPSAMPEADIPYSYESHRDDLLAFLRTRAEPAHRRPFVRRGGRAARRVARASAGTKPDPSRAAFGSFLPEAAPGLEAEQAGRAAMLRESIDERTRGRVYPRGGAVAGRCRAHVDRRAAASVATPRARPPSAIRSLPASSGPPAPSPASSTTRRRAPRRRRPPAPARAARRGSAPRARP